MPIPPIPAGVATAAMVSSSIPKWEKLTMGLSAVFETDAVPCQLERLPFRLRFGKTISFL